MIAKEETSNISVIICAYTEKRWGDLLAAVESVQKQSLSPDEFIVVIDHNPSLYARAKAAFQQLIVLENSDQKGISGARNSGVAVAKGAIVAFLDDDAIAEKDWLRWLARSCADPQVLGVGGIVEPLWAEKRPAWFPHEFSWVVGCSYQDIPRERIPVRNTFMGCSCLKREVLMGIGGFKNGIGRVSDNAYGGDSEPCIRAAQRWPDKLFLLEPRARIHHRVSRYRASWRYFLRRCYREGLSKALIAKHVGTKDSLSAERMHTLLTLPKGVFRGLQDALFRGDPTGLLRAGAIIVGFTVTAIGYLIGSVSRHCSIGF